MTGERCCYCGAPAEESDHVEAKSKGGRDDWPNRSPVCRDCNVAKGTQDLLGFLLAKREGVDADQLRKALSGMRQHREELDKARAAVTATMAKTLKDAQETPGISMTEASRLAGISRVMAYDMLKD
jgi:hypothetical protein